MYESMFPSNSFTLPGNGLGATMGLGYGRARNEVLGGTLQASELLRSGYEDLFRGRAAGMIGGFGEMQSRLGAETASQGLSQDVLQRLMYAPGQELQANLGAAAGEAQSGFAFDLAKLLKGTGGELAGLTQEHLAAFINKEVAKRAAKGAMRGGLISAGGAIAGGMIGGPMGASFGAQLGGQLGGGGGGYSDYNTDDDGSYGP